MNNHIFKHKKQCNKKALLNIFFVTTLACVLVPITKADTLGDPQLLNDDDQKATKQKDSKRLGICGKKELLDEVRLNIKTNLMSLKLANLLENGFEPILYGDERQIKRLKSKNMGCNSGNFAENAQCLYDKIKDQNLKTEFGTFAKRLAKANMTFDAEVVNINSCSVRGVTFIFDSGDKITYNYTDIGHTPKAYSNKTLELITFETKGQNASVNSNFVPYAAMLADIDNYYNGKGVMINNALKGGCPNGNYTIPSNSKTKQEKVYSCAGGLYKAGILKEISKQKIKNEEKDNIIVFYYSHSGGALIERKYALSKYVDEQEYEAVGQNTNLYAKAYQKAVSKIKAPTPNKAEKDLEKFKEQALSSFDPSNVAQSVLEKLINDEWQAYIQVQDYNAGKQTKAPDKETLQKAKSYQQKEEKQQKQLADMMKISQEWNNKILAYKQKLEEETKKEYDKMLESYQKPQLDTPEQILAYITKEKIEPIYERISTQNLMIERDDEDSEFYTKCEFVEEACNAKLQTGCRVIGKKCGVIWNDNSPKKGMGEEYQITYKDLIDKSYFKDNVNAELDLLLKQRKEDNATKKVESTPPKPEPAPQEQKIIQPIDILRF